MEIELQCFNATTMAELSDGSTEQIKTALVTIGDETEDGISIDITQVKPMFADEWDYIDGREQTNATIKRVFGFSDFLAWERK